MSDERLKKSAGEAKTSRAMDDRAVTEDRTLSDQERLEIFRQQHHQAALPKLPDIPGFHVCWLSTTNPRDSIHQRLRLGYELIKADDLPGYELFKVKSGDFPGCVSVNEMVAAKLPLSLYQAFMRHNHHDAPAAEEDRYKAPLDAIREEARDRGLRIREGEEADAWV
jgi:hypothetical protein